MKRVSVLMLAVLMLLSVVLGGCSVKGEKLLQGTWEGKVDILPILQSEMDDATGEFSEYFDLDKSYKVTATISFAEDGTYKDSIDEDEMRDVFEDIMNDLADAMVPALEDMIKKEGATVEEFEEVAGMSLEEYIEQEFENAIDFEDAFPDLEGDGEWELDGDELTVDGVTYTVELEKSSLTFTDCDDKDDEFWALAKNVTFKKQ